MSLYVVVRKNPYFKCGTYLEEDADGVRPCKITPNGSGGLCARPLKDAIITPMNADLEACLAKFDQNGGLDPKLLDIIKNEAFKK